MLDKISKPELLVMVIGIITGVAYFFLPLTYLLLLVAGLAGAVLIIWRVEIGIAALLLSFSFLPTLVTIGLTGLIVFSFALKVITHQIQVKYSPLGLSILIFVITILFATLFSVTPIGSFKVAAVFCLYIMLFIVIINTVDNKRLLYLFIFCLILSASLQSLYGIYQYAVGIPTIDESWTDPTLFPEITTRVFGSLDNPNILAQFLELIIPLTLGLFWTTRNYLRKTVLLGLACIMVLCLVFTYSRAGWLAFALSVLVFGILRDRRVILLGILACFVSLFAAPDLIISRLASITSGESSVTYRTFIWKSALIMIRDLWYSGVGLGVEAFQKVYTSLYMRQGVFAFHTHNLYLQLLVETGILGLLSFLAVVYTTFKYGLNTMLIKANEVSKSIVAALLAGLSAFLLHGLTENSFYNFKIVLLFWLVVALIMAVRQMDEPTEPEAEVL